MLTHTMGSSLTLAPLRSLMRVREAAHELDLRDETAQALGFAEAGARFENTSRQAIVTIISNHYENSKKLGPVDNHLEAISAATRFQQAA